MRNRVAIFVAGLGFLIGQPMITRHSSEAAAQIPLPSGQFSLVAQGSSAICLNPGTGAQESCLTNGMPTSGVLVVPLSFIGNGSFTHDSAGSSCGVISQVLSLLPLNPSSPFNTSPPTVLTNVHVVGKLIDYDSATGIGHRSLSDYTGGGTCSGASFNKDGATQVGTTTEQFTVTSRGNRIEALVTSTTDPGTGDFLASATELKQGAQNEQ